MIGKILAIVLSVSPRILLIIACLSTSLGLLAMVLPSFFSNSLVIMGGMTLAHVFGLGGVIFFALSILREVITREKPDFTASKARKK